MIIMVMGLPGSGKSHFASRLAALIGAEYINSDQVRAQIFNSSSYSQRGKSMVYEEMLELANRAVQAGKDTVLDATFYTDGIRKKFLAMLEPQDDDKTTDR